MKNPILRVGALATSITLAAAFVAYRGGIFDRWSSTSYAAATPAKGDPHRSILSSSKSGAIITPKPAETAPATTTASQPRTVISGSKTFIITPPEPARPPIIMSGSKSDIMMTPSAPPIMGGSKSIIITPPPPATGSKK